VPPKKKKTQKNKKRTNQDSSLELGMGFPLEIILR
jgi:hypothetical protein